MEFVGIIVAVIVLHQISKIIRNWRLADEIENETIEFLTLYNKMLKEMQKEDSKEIRHGGAGLKYKICVKSGDWGNFYKTMNEIAKEILADYDKIDQNYWNWAETEKYIYLQKQRDIILDLSSKLSHYLWLNEIN